MRVIIQGNWSNCVGTDYCYALGIYNSLEDSNSDAECYALEHWEPDLEEDEEDEGPDFWVEEYDPEVHDMLRAGGGSFQEDFGRM